MPALWHAAVGLRTGAATDLAASVVARIANGTLQRLDLNAIIDRVDVGHVIARSGHRGGPQPGGPGTPCSGRWTSGGSSSDSTFAALAKEAMEGIDMGEVIRESTTSIRSDTVDAVRDQAMRADGLVAPGVVDRALRRPIGGG